MKPKHTPGPWLADAPYEDDDFVQVAVIGPGPARGSTFVEDQIAHVFDLNKTPSEFAANVRLIAAAPKLLAVLKDCPLPSTMGDASEHYRRFYAWLNGPVREALEDAEPADTDPDEPAPVTAPLGMGGSQ